MLKYALSGALFFAAVAPAAADFYIVRSPGSKTCTIVEERPSASTQITVIGNKVYKTRMEADTALKTVCVEN
jgi:hypothetical protein